MENLVVVYLVLVVIATVVVVVHRVVHRSVRPDVVRPTPAAATGGVALEAPRLPPGRTVEEYAQAGLLDLRIMLAQAARRSE